MTNSMGRTGARVGLAVAVILPLLSACGSAPRQEWIEPAED
jgi:hypothetical protein